MTIPKQYIKALRVEPGTLQPRVGPGLLGGDQGDRLGTVEAAHPHAVDDLGGLDHQLRRDADREGCGPLLGEQAHPGASGEHGVPGGRDVPAQRGGRAEPGDDDGIACGHAEPPAFLLT